MPNAIVPAAAAGLPNQLFDAELVRLGRELEMTDADRAAFQAVADLPCEDPVYERLWGVRAKIEAIPATGLAGLFVKARAAELALKYDSEFECNLPGSFVTLAQSLIGDLKAIEARTAACPVESIARDLVEIYEVEDIIDEDEPANKIGAHILRRERQTAVLTARRSALLDVAMAIPAKSLAGALFQICWIGEFADQFEPTTYDMDKIFRCACSAARVIEEAAGMSRNETGAGHLLREEFSPHVAAEEAFTERRAKQCAHAAGAAQAA